MKLLTSKPFINSSRIFENCVYLMGVKLKVCMENFGNTQRFGNHILGSMLNARERLTSGIKELSFGGKI